MVINIELPEIFVDKLVSLPEQGMGYQLVNVRLKGGILLTNRKVINSTYLLLNEDEDFTSNDIEQVDIAK